MAKGWLRAAQQVERGDSRARSGRRAESRARSCGQPRGRTLQQSVNTPSLPPRAHPPRLQDPLWARAWVKKTTAASFLGLVSDSSRALAGRQKSLFVPFPDGPTQEVTSWAPRAGALPGTPGPPRIARSSDTAGHALERWGGVGAGGEVGGRGRVAGLGGAGLERQGETQRLGTGALSPARLLRQGKEPWQSLIFPPF